MKRNESIQAESFLKNRKRHDHLRRAIALLSAFVMLFTMNTLKRNADTLEHLPMCHMEEHEHTELCYDEGGNLICLLPEHVHTDACYQERPVKEEEEQDLDALVAASDDDLTDAEPEDDGEADPAEDAAVEEVLPFVLGESAMLSEIIEAMKLPVALKDVVAVGPVENDKAHEGLLLAEVQENDYRISALRDFEDAELALILVNGEIETVMLADGKAAANDAADVEIAENAPADAGNEEKPTEVEDEATETDSNEPKQTEVEGDDAQADMPAVEETDKIEEPEQAKEAEEKADEADDTNNIEETAKADTTDETADTTDETADETDETADETADTTDATDETADETDETADETDETADETADTTDATDETADATDETADATDETDETADATDETAEAKDDAADETAEAKDDATDDAADETAEAKDDATDETAEAKDDAADETAEAKDDATDKTDETADATDETAEAKDDATDETAEAKDDATDETDETAEAKDDATDETAEAKDDATDETADATDEDGEAADATDEDGDALDETEADGEAEDGEDAAADEAVEEQTRAASIVVDLSSVDLMEAATVEGDTVNLSVAKLLSAEDDTVNVEGELEVDHEEFANTATVTGGDTDVLEVQDGVITLSAEALERGSLTLQTQTETVEEDVTTVTTQTVDIELTGYTGRTTEEIGGDPEVQIVPAEGNSLPADAFATIEKTDVPDDMLEAESVEGVMENAVAYDISVRIDNENQDKISNTGDVAVTVTPKDLNMLADVPVGATVGNLEYKLYHIHDDGTCEEVKDAEFVVAEDGTVNSVTFNTDSFSTYIIKYTVEFHNDDKEVVINGGSQVLLSTLIDRLALARATGEVIGVDEVASVEFATPDLFIVEEVANGAEIELNAGTDAIEIVVITTAHDFVITSLQPFDETDMVLTLTNGEEIVVKVTDEPGDMTWTTTIKIFDSSAVIVTDDNNAAIRTTGEMMVPDPAFTNNYYVLATLKTTTDEAGTQTDHYWYDIVPVDLKNLQDTSVSVTFDTLKSADGTTTTHRLKNGENVKTRLINSGSTVLTADNFSLSNGSGATGYALIGFNPDFDGYTLVNNGGASLSDSIESNYVFGGNPSASSGDGDEIHIKHQLENKEYRVRLRFSEGSTAAIVNNPDANNDEQTNNRYYVLAEVTHSSGTKTYGWASVAGDVPTTPDTEGWLYKDIPITKWYNADGNIQSNEVFTGHEPSVKVSLIKSFYQENTFSYFQFSRPSNLSAGYSVIYSEGAQFNGYIVHYDSRSSRGDSEYYTYPTTDNGNHPLTVCYDQIDLTGMTIEAEYDYRTILGPNVYYGIVAEHLYQPNHLQTNFAVNHFSGHGHDVRPDLSGDKSGGNIVIGEFNISDGTKRNSVGEVATDPTWGRLKVGKPLNGTLLVFADKNSGYKEGDTQANVWDNPDQTVVVPVEGKSFAEGIVEPGIQYMQRISATLALKPINYTPTLSGNTALIDTSPFDENATIYIDGDAIKAAIENPGGITINKKNNQTIVFNFTDKATTRSLNITQFTVSQPNFANWGYPNGYTTESPEATGSNQNKVMDDIARHIVWNLASCTRKVTINTAGGMFLQPNDDSEIEIKGTTAGWIVSDGYVYNGTAEWHNVFEEMVESNEAHLYALKLLDGKLPVNKTYSFKLDMLKYTGPGTTEGKPQTKEWTNVQTKQNQGATVSFDNIAVGEPANAPTDPNKLKVGWNIFRISEVGGVANTITDSTVYYAAVYVEPIVTALNNFDQIHYTVTDPVYYTSFDENAFIPFKPNQDDPNPTLTGMGGVFSRMPVFKNETVTNGLTLMKKVTGTDAANKSFTFGIEIWKEVESHRVALDPDDLQGVTCKWSAQPTTKTSDEDTYTYAEVKLQNGKKITIDGLPQDAKYKITEIKIGNKAINSTNDPDSDGYIDAYKPVSVTADGYTAGNEPTITTEANGAPSITGTIVDAEATYAVTYVNDYKADGNINLAVTKALQDENSTQMRLVADMFKFTATVNGKTYTGYNAAADAGTPAAVVFEDLTAGKLTFTQDDMAGATLDADGHMSKEVTVVISEGRGKLTDAAINQYNTDNTAHFDYNKVSYDKDKVITLVLTDKGNGTIEVKPKDWPSNGDPILGYTYNSETMTVSVSFENKLVKKATATLEGTKTMVNRKLNKAEFTFNAKLIRVDSTDVTEAGQEAASEADANYADGLQNHLSGLMAKRAQASPVDFSGYNEATPSDAPSAGPYTSNITFPTVYYTATGIYVYEITEDTTSLADGVQQQANSTTTYYAKVEVNSLESGSNPNVTYWKSFANGNLSEQVQSDQKMNFINESTDKFEVTKSWKTANNADATGAKWVTFKVFNLNVKDRPALTNTQLTDHVAAKADTGSTGTVELDESDGTVKLTCDSDGNWPVAVFTGLAAGRYQIVETAHTEADNLTTTYTVGTTTSSVGIVKTGQTLTIVNKERNDTYTHITVKKKWKVEGQEGTYTPATGTAQFELWQQMTTKGGTSGGDEIGVKVTINGNNQIMKGHVGEFVRVEFTATVKDNCAGQANGNKAYTKYFDGANTDGTPTGSPVQGNTYSPTAPAQFENNQPYTIVYSVPIVATIVNGNSAKGMEVEIKTDGLDNISIDMQNKVEIDPGITEHGPTKLQDFTVSGPGWTWTSSRLPVSLNNGATTYKYFIKEVNIPDTISSVTYDPAGSAADRSGMITTSGAAIINVTNTRKTGSLNIRKTGKVNGANPTDDNKAKIDGDYSFTVAGEGYSRTVTITIANGEATAVSPMTDASVASGVVTLSNLPTGSYTVTENLTPAQQAAGISLLSSTNTTVTVTGSDSGTIPTAVFVNNNPFVETNIPGIKSFTNGTIAQNQFSFTIARGENDTSAPLPSTTTASAATDGSFAFGPIQYKLSDLGSAASKTFTYTITENLPSGVTATAEDRAAGFKRVNGIQYDLTPKTVNVLVYYDAATGVMTATVDPQTGASFTNVKLGKLTVTKYVTLSENPDTGAANKEFWVAVYSDRTANTKVAGPKKITVDSNGSGTVEFGDLPEGTYYVYELTAENGTPITGDTARIDGVDYVVTTENTGAKIEVNATTQQLTDGSATITNAHYTVDLNIVKVDKNDTTKTLTGAKFKIRRKDLGSTGDYQVFDNTAFEKNADNQSTGIVEVDNQGRIALTGLLPGEYEVSEVKAPAGYILLNSVFTFTIRANGTVNYANGNNMVTYTSADSLFQVKNEPGPRLPSTGGAGTAPIYAAGAGLLLLAVLGFILSARRKARDGIV